MSHTFTNAQISELFRNIAAAYEILGENRFKIIAYEKAAETIAGLPLSVQSSLKDELPGIGKTIRSHLEELFKSGKVSHFESVFSKVPTAVFPLLSVSGIGPKKAYKLVQTLKLTKPDTVIDDLYIACKKRKIETIEGFGEKSQEDLIRHIEEYRKGAVKEKRIRLDEALFIAQSVVVHMKQSPDVEKIDTLGSLRRRAESIGDIDIAVATLNPESVLSHFLMYPHESVIERGPSGASLLLANGRQIDLRVGHPDSYGAMLQYFTGSKNHNIALRSYALDRGVSLNEYGIKNMKTGKLKKIPDEKRFYKELGMQWIPPVLREDTGEVRAAIDGELPALIQPDDIRGDLHIHDAYDIHSSHDIGTATFKEILIKTEQTGYSYIGISDHNPRISHSSEKDICTVLKRRKSYYEHEYYSYTKSTRTPIMYFTMLEVDITPSGDLALPDNAFDYLDAVIVSVHSSFTMPIEQMTERIRKAISAHPKVRILGHPTGRLIGSRRSIEADWSDIFRLAAQRSVVMEINAHPSRLDLPDALIREAVKHGLKCAINTDSHDLDGMDVMQYGVWTAQRGWLEKKDVVNTMPYHDILIWLKGGEL